MLQTVVQFALRMQRDEQADSNMLRQRDRSVGKTLSHLRSHPVRQLTAWLTQVSTEDDRTRARYAARAQHMAVVLLMLLGLCIGGGTAAAAFYYDGRHPINILPILAIFVFLPVVMLLPLLLALLPSAWVNALPLLSSLNASRAMILTGIMGMITQVLPQPYREALQEAAGRQEAYRRVYGRMQKWMLLSWSQTFTLAFVLGALLWFAYRLVVTDLAFAWSTTLQTEQSDALYGWMQRLTDTLAMPWSAFWPQAQPTLELIRDTHYFRLQAGILPNRAGPGALGGWWMFLMMSMVGYGLLPRLVSLAFCIWRYRLASHWCLVHTPGAADVLDRLNNVLIETESLAEDVVPEAQNKAEAEPLGAPHDAALPTIARAVVVNWSAVPVTEEDVRQLLYQALALDIRQQFHAGGAQTLEEDADVISQVAKALRPNPSEAPRRPEQLVVLVKAWEPPVMDMVDFLGDLRQALNDGCRIRVAPLWIPHGDTVSDGNAAVYIEQWRHKMATLGDPWLSVRTLRLDAPAVNGNQEQSDA